jgi:hypothetical protein
MMISNDTSTYRKLEGGPTVGGGLTAVGAAMGRVGEGGAAEGMVLQAVRRGDLERKVRRELPGHALRWPFAWTWNICSAWRYSTFVSVCVSIYFLHFECNYSIQ